MTPDDARRPAGGLAGAAPRPAPASSSDVLPGAPVPAVRLGAHRPRRSPLRDVLPLLVVALVVAVVGVGVWRLAGATPSTVTASGGPADLRAGDPAAGPAGPATGTPTATSVPATAGASGASASATGTPTLGATGAPGATTSVPSGPAAPVDRSLPVTVVNATGRTGLAGRAATTLRGTGWTALTANGTQRPSTTVVSYPRESLAASARSVADSLVAGGYLAAAPATELTQRFGTDRITVVLGADAAAS